MITRMNIPNSTIANAVASTSRAIAILDFEGRLAYVNHAYLKMCGHTNSTEVLGHRIDESWQSSQSFQTALQVLQNREIFTGELITKNIEGSPLVAELTLSPIKDGIDNNKFYVACFIDITQRNKVEQALRESVQFTASLLNNYEHPIVVINPDTSIRYVNPAVESLTGFSTEELIGLKPPYPWLTTESLPRTEHDFQVAMNRGKTWYEEQYRKKNGDLFWAEVTSVPIKNNDEPHYFMTMWVDITERKQMEAELKKEKELAETYLNIVGVMVATIDKTGKIRMINRRGCDLLGYEQDELLGRDWSKILVSEENRQDFKNTLRNLFEGVLDSINYFEISLISKSGQEKRIALNYIPLKDATGTLTGVLMAGEDVTEMRKAQERLQHSRLLVSLGEMTAGIAHEVNNPLGSILLYSELLMSGDIPPQIKKDLKIIHDEAKRAAKIMTDLLTYGKQTKPQMRRVNLHSLLNKVISMRKYPQRLKNINVSINYSSEPLYVIGDSTQLVQAFMNTILNAEDALKNSANGKIIVATHKDSQWAKVIIADNGTGIPEANLGQIFYPFFTTKPTGEGTGLGLSTSYGIITGHSGLIRAENNEMGGATIVIELPIIKNVSRKKTRSDR